VFSKGYINQQKSEEKAERDRTNALHEKLLFVDLLAQRLEFSMVRLSRLIAAYAQRILADLHTFA
jgi:hypothetical protein